MARLIGVDKIKISVPNITSFGKCAPVVNKFPFDYRNHRCIKLVANRQLLGGDSKFNSQLTASNQSDLCADCSVMINLRSNI